MSRAIGSNFLERTTPIIQRLVFGDDQQIRVWHGLAECRQKEFRVGSSCLQCIQKYFHGLEGRQLRELFAEQRDTLEFVRMIQQIIAPGS